MKIDVNSPAVNMVSVNSPTNKVSSGSAASVKVSTEDRTTFHSDSLSVQSLTSQAMQSSEVRQDKVDALSQAVKSGSYNADASKTASAIASHEG